MDGVICGNLMVLSRNSQTIDNAENLFFLAIEEFIQ